MMQFESHGSEFSLQAAVSDDKLKLELALPEKSTLFRTVANWLGTRTSSSAMSVKRERFLASIY